MPLTGLWDAYADYKKDNPPLGVSTPVQLAIGGLVACIDTIVAEGDEQTELYLMGLASHAFQMVEPHCNQFEGERISVLEHVAQLLTFKQV